MAKVVTVDKDECTSCNLCVDTVPEYFQLDDDDMAESHNDGSNLNAAEVPEGDEDKVQEAIDSCPAECIEWK